VEGGRIERVEQLRQSIEADLDLCLWLGRRMVIGLRHDSGPCDDTHASPGIVLNKSRYLSLDRDRDDRCPLFPRKQAFATGRTAPDGRNVNLFRFDRSLLIWINRLPCRMVDVLGSLAINGRPSHEINQDVSGGCANDACGDVWTR
jgi:hypothetical protein